MPATIPADRKTPYVFVGKSGLKVSNICLGTMTFGESQFLGGQLDASQSHQILNRFAEWGGNFIDTADAYGPRTSEEIIGQWLERQPRDKFVIATKCRAEMGLEQDANNVGLSRRHITASVDGSLQRLRTDYIDLFQSHLWDSGVPLEETLRTLDDLVRLGKIRYVGVSNVLGWQMQKIISTSEKLGLNPVISLQQQYSLLSRDSEFEAFQVCKAEGLGVLPWSPLKGGLLSGKVKRGVKPTEGRLGWVANNENRAMEAVPNWKNLEDKTFDVIEAAEEIAKKHGRSVAQVAIRWLLQRDVVSSVLIGARTVQQLDDNIGAAAGWSLTKEEMQKLDDLSYPSQPYPSEYVLAVNKDRLNPRFQDTLVRSVVV
ncbi:hypothetical protein BsWGS_08523 [Bradybaena similaris]